MLPAHQEIGVDGEGHGTHLLAQDGQRAPVHLLQRAPVDELGGLLRRTGREAAVSQLAIRHQVVELGLQPLCGEVIARADRLDGDGAGLGEIAQQNGAAGFGVRRIDRGFGGLGGCARIFFGGRDGISPYLRRTVRRGGALLDEGGLVLRQVVGGDPARGEAAGGGDLHRLDAPAAGELADPARRVHGAAFGDLQRGEVAQRLEEQRQFLRGARMHGGRDVLQPLAHLAHRLGTQQVGQVHVLEQVLQQLAADGHRLQLALGLGRVPLVHEDADEVVEQALRHRRWRQRLHRGHLDFAGLDAAQDALQVRPVHDLLQAVAVGLGDDGEILEAAHQLQQILGAQPLQPEGRALAALAGQEQRPRRVLAKLSAEDRRVGQLGQDALARLVRPHRAEQVQRDVGLRLREAEEDAVVVALHLHLDARALAQRAGQRQPPQPVDLAAKGRLDHQPLVAQRVLEDLDQDAAVRRNGAGVVELACHVVDHVPGRRRVQRIVGAQPGEHRLHGRFFLSLADGAVVGQIQRGAHRVQPLCHGTPERADALTQFIGAPRKVAAPEGHARRRARRIGDDDFVVGQLDDAPDLRAEQQRVADARLVDELLVQLAELGLAVGQVGVERAAVGDGAAVGQRQQPRPRQRGQPVVDAIPHQPRPQFAMRLAGIAPGKHVEHGGVGARRQLAIRVGAAEQGVEFIDLPFLHRDHSHDLLRQNIERVARRVDRLDLAAQHAAGHRRRLHDVLAMRGEDAPAAGLADEMAGAAHALQALRHRLGRLQLHDEIDRADVDAQFQRRRADERRQRARLERLLQRQPRLLGHAAVVGADGVGMRPAPRAKHAHAFGDAAFVEGGAAGGVKRQT